MRETKKEGARLCRDIECSEEEIVRHTFGLSKLASVTSGVSLSVGVASDTREGWSMLSCVVSNKGQKFECSKTVAKNDQSRTYPTYLEERSRSEGSSKGGCGLRTAS